MDNLEQLKDNLLQLKSKLESERPVLWNEFPDIGLYKDQVISYMQRQLIRFDEDGQITSAMINNYIKDKLMPRTDGKKYSREHLAGLTEICILKQILSVNSTGQLLGMELEETDPESFYNKFVQILNKALCDTAERIDPEWELEALSDMALRLAISSYCDKLASERLLDILRSRQLTELQSKADKKEKPEKKADKKPDK